MAARQRPSAPRAARGPAAPTTIHDVARRARVSTATVSRCLSGTGRVRPELSARVVAAARALRYEPNRVARSLRTRATRTVGLVIPDIQNPFFTGIVRGLEDVLLAEGYHILLGNSDDDAEREARYLRLLLAEGAVGIVFVPVAARPTSYAELLRSGVAVVTVDRLVDGLSTDRVSVDNRTGAEEATRHLLRLGHRRIAYVGGPSHLSVARERRAGFRDALRQARLPPGEALVREADFREAGGYAVSRTLLRNASPPSALFVANNLMTLGVLRCIHELGRRIPEDVALVSFDDMTWAASLDPPLTAVAQPTYEIGASAAQLLVDRLRDGEQPPRHVKLSTRLVVRASCGAGGQVRTGAAQSPHDPGRSRRSRC
jgi:LacI family transcriptional regulator